MSTHAARLAEIDAELADILASRRKIITTGQAYTAEGRQMTRADLKFLRELEVELRRERAALARRGRIRTFGVVRA